MSKAGDLLVRCCLRLNRLPSLVLCFALVLLQACFMDFYLVHHLTIEHLFWALGDLLVVICVIVCFISTSAFHSDQHLSQDGTETAARKHNYTIVWVTWVAMQTLLAGKVIVISMTFGGELDEEASFFGPNTLKTSIALGSCIFVLLLTSQHTAPPSSDRRRYIEELTGTVVFDILDTADILDVLFDADDRPGLSTGIPEMILAVATLNLLLPTVPLFTLSCTKFGMEKLSKRLVYIHRLLLVMMVNIPNLIVRMMLWHGFSVGISPFTLKNIIVLCMTGYEFYEHKKEKYEEHEREAEEGRHGGNMNDFSNVDSGSKSDTADQDGQSRHSDGIHFDIESRMVTSI